MQKRTSPLQASAPSEFAVCLDITSCALRTIKIAFSPFLLLFLFIFRCVTFLSNCVADQFGYQFMHEVQVSLTLRVLAPTVYFVFPSEFVLLQTCACVIPTVMEDIEAELGVMTEMRQEAPKV